MSVSILIPAAGASSRMRGRDKLAKIVDGKPLLRLVTERALSQSGEVVVALPPQSNRLEFLSGLYVKVIEVENASEGMAASLRDGIREISPDATGVMILPADMPEITTEDIAKVIQSFETNAEISRGCTAEGVAGHPVVFPRSDFEAISGLKGDEGARSLLKDRNVIEVPLPKNHAVTDLDTPEDWERWQSDLGSQ